jgi:hypothetical protein
MKKILFLFFVAISVGVYRNKNDESYEKLIDNIIYNFIDEVENKYNLHCYGVGGSMPYDIESVMVSFQKKNGFKDLEEARYLEVMLTKSLNKKINNDDRIRPFLHQNPFPLSKTNIKIAVFNKSEFNKEEIVFVFQKENTIFYAIDEGIRYKSKYSESFSDAEEKVKSYKLINNKETLK